MLLPEAPSHPSFSRGSTRDGPATPSEAGENEGEEENGMGTVLGFLPPSRSCLRSASVSRLGSQLAACVGMA